MISIWPGHLHGIGSRLASKNGIRHHATEKYPENKGQRYMPVTVKKANDLLVEASSQGFSENLHSSYTMGNGMSFS